MTISTKSFARRPIVVADIHPDPSVCFARSLRPILPARLAFF
jgi:hypothetical protein